jgi:DNA polymerase-3 subunit delta'
MKRGADEGAPESDAYPGARAPRLAPHVVGHAGAQAEMLNAYRSGRLAHAWLIAGPEGIGKATLAWAFARFVLANPDPAAPAVAQARDLFVPADHPAARQLASHSHPDFALLRRELNPKGKGFFTEIRIDDVRAAQGVFRMASAFDGWRVVLVDSADDLNRAGANALLKTIEEPPPRALVLIVSHRPGQLPPTIRSRCRRLTLEPLAAGEVEEIVRSQGEPWSEARTIAEAAARSGGSAREALRRLDPERAEMGAAIDALVAKLPGVDWRAALRLADRFAGAAGAEAHELFVLAIYDWLAARMRTRPTPERSEAAAELWDKLRAGAREVDALNIDRKTHALALLQEIAERARRL